MDTSFGKRFISSIALYLGTAWVIIEATTYFVNRYKFPGYLGDALTILLGFGFITLLLIEWNNFRKTRVILPLHFVNSLAAVLSIYFFISAERKSDVYQYDLTDKISIAVLPFKDISPENQYAWIGDGFCREIINQLNLVKSIDIKSPSASFYFKDKDMELISVANLLGVKNLLEGSVQVIDSIMRISVNLVDPFTGSQMWNESFDRNVRNFMNVQKEIAIKIAEKIRAEISENELEKINASYTDNKLAYNAFMQGKYHFWLLTPQDIYKANNYFRQAISMDPSFAEAYVYLGLTYNEYGGQWLGISPDSAYSVVESLANKALSIKPGLPLAKFLIANVEYFYKWDYTNGVRIATEAIDATTYYDDMLLIYTLMLDFTKNFEASLEFSQQYIDKNPTSTMGYHAHGAAYLAHGDALEAIPYFQKVLELNPYYAWTRLLLAESFLYTGNKEVSRAHWDTLYQMDPTAPSFIEGLNRVCYFSGDKNLSDSLFQSLIEINKKIPIPFQMAKAYAIRGDSDHMFEQLEISYQMKDIQMVSLWREFPFEPYHDDPRFAELMRKMHFPF